MWNYWAYGCPIASEIPISILLPEADGGASRAEAGSLVSVALAPGEISPLLPTAVDQRSLAVQVADQCTTLYLKNIGTFSIKQGQSVICDLDLQATAAMVDVALSGAVMAALLCQRQSFVAHGSAVALEEGAAIFLGDSGAGKSSFAMAMHQAGYPILTDDLIAIHMIEGQPHLLPAFPQTRVTRDTASALNLDWAQLIELSTPQKRGFRFVAEFIPRPLPLRQIFILKQSDVAIAMTPLAPHEKIMELMHHSDAMKLLTSDPSMHFRACASLANQVPIHYLERPKDWSKLPDVMHALQRHWHVHANSSR